MKRLFAILIVAYLAWPTFVLAEAIQVNQHTAIVLDVRPASSYHQSGDETNYTGMVYCDSVLIRFRTSLLHRPITVWQIYTRGDSSTDPRRPAIGDRISVYYHPRATLFIMGAIKDRTRK